MELQDIQTKINTLLTGTERKIVFWYDDDASYAEDIGSLQLASGNKKWILTEDNWFETKLLLEVRDTESNYLVYAPFARPEDKANLLADTFYYSEHFYSDKIVQLCGDLGIPVECQDEMKRLKKFWNATNTAKFQNLQIQNYTVDSIDLGILCVLGGVRISNFEELLRNVLLAGIDENALLKRFATQKMENVFWKFCEEQYGYKDSAPTLQKLLITMLVTYTDTLANGNIPKHWKTFLSSKQNDIIVFVKNLMNNEESKEFYDQEAEKIASELELARFIKSIPLESILGSDTFADFDQNLIFWIIAKLEDGTLDERIDGMTIPEICQSRMKNCYHYVDRFENYYQMLLSAYNVLREAPQHLYFSKPEDVVKEYTQNLYKIDTWYRKFYYYMDKLGMDPQIEKVRDLVENIYTNKYLSDSSYQWNQVLSDKAYMTYEGTRQEDFFRTCVRPFMRDRGRNVRVIVIISDAFRYECAKELQRNFDLDEKCEATISHMLSVLPSETTLGMASLLPNKDIVVDENLNVTVDGMPCGNSMEDRRKILQATIPRSGCFDFDVIKNAKQEEVRKMLQDQDVVYIYQNQIDDRGESKKSENEVFNACQEAIEEIQTLVRRLTGFISATRFLITADHGFIYKRDKLEENDKISLNKSEVSTVNKRYLISKNAIRGDAVVSRALTYLSMLNKAYVTTPKGADIIKAPGGGQNYVHGGSSLQEMVVPVLKVVTFKGKQDTSMVNVELSYSTNRITDIVVHLEFIQMEAVSDTMKPRKLMAFFVDDAGNKISFDVPLIANTTDDNPQNRVMREKFILKSGNYTRGKDYYLVLADMNNEKNEHHRYRFEIDIAGIY